VTAAVTLAARRDAPQELFSAFFPQPAASNLPPVFSCAGRISLFSLFTTPFAAKELRL
jgi:hypothetical protein